METRGKSNVYLIGSAESDILGAKLPSHRQAFGYFLHLHKVENLTVRDSSRQTIEKVFGFWNKAGIPVRAVKHCIDKLEAFLLNGKASKSIMDGESYLLNQNVFISQSV